MKPSVSAGSGHRPIAESINAQGFALVEAPTKIVAVAAKIFEFAPNFFKQSSTRKMRESFHNLASGYRGIGAEFSVSPKRYDLLESFSFLPAEEPLVRGNLSETAADLYDLLREYASSVECLVKDTISDLAHIYGLNTQQLSFFSRRYSHTQINCYEPYRWQRRILVDPHEDGVLLTTLVADTDGLEVLDSQGNYVSIECSRNAMILMAGELLALLTGYSIKPIRHRVKRYGSQKLRLSLVHLANLNIDATVSPWLVSEQNRDINIIDKAINNPTRFGLPPLKPKKLSK